MLLRGEGNGGVGGAGRGGGGGEVYGTAGSGRVISIYAPHGWWIEHCEEHHYIATHDRIECIKVANLMILLLPYYLYNSDWGSQRYAALARGTSVTIPYAQVPQLRFLIDSIISASVISLGSSGVIIVSRATGFGVWF